MLGRTGLKRLTGRAMPTLIIAANSPDVDAFAGLLGGHGLAVRRGITHGPLAMLVLPVLLTGLVMAWNRWRPAAEPVKPGALLFLAFVGTLSHPALDWLNTYGIRLLEPFSSRWFHGDTLFIIDPWIWIALILGLELSWRAERRGRDWRGPAFAAFAGMTAYVAANFAISRQAESLGAEAVLALVREPGTEQIDRSIYRRGAGPISPHPGVVRAEEVVASPQPIWSWRRRVLWRGGGLYGTLDYDPLREWDGLIFDGAVGRTRLDDPRLAAALRRSADARAFHFWSRMPLVIEQDGRLWLADQRFVDRRRRTGRRAFLIPLDSGAAAP